jgi:SAM-dependent methyltransferase
MKLLTEEELIWSPVVANINMNRKRKATGINSYERDVKLSPIKLLLQRIETNGTAAWLDLCCGEGNALIEAAITLQRKDVQHTTRLTGIDLVDHFTTIPTGINNLQFLVSSIDKWVASQQYDLITCVHGLHYAGDKLAALAKTFAALKHDGVFIANFDIASIQVKNVDTKKYLQNIFAKHGVQYNVRSHIITCNGAKDIDFGVVYIGANDGAGPNYTGQEAVDGYYQLV